MPAHLQLQEFVQALQFHLRSVPPLQQRAATEEEAHEIEQALRAPAMVIFIHGDHASGIESAEHAGRAPLHDALELDSHTATTVSVTMANQREQQKKDTEFVIDEFDQISDDWQRARFADFLKQISEARLPIRFILCDVSEALRELLSAHESSYCCVDELAAEYLPRDGDVSDPVNAAAESLGKTFPHYVHLISEELFWDMLNDPTFARSVR